MGNPIGVCDVEPVGCMVVVQRGRSETSFILDLKCHQCIDDRGNVGTGYAACLGYP